jgi:PAS domain S-box-containing protein
MSIVASPPIGLAVWLGLSEWLSLATAVMAVVLLRVSGRNLARRRQAEAALRDLRNLHSRIVSSLPMGMYTYRLGPDGRLRLTYANPAADKILGLDHAGMAGKPIEEVFPALARTEAPEKIRQVAETGQSWFQPRFEYWEERFGGIYEVHAFRICPGEAAVIFSDVTHRCQVEDRLQEYYFINDAIIESSPAGIAAIDRDRNLIIWNPACERMFGWKAKEILGKPMPFLPDSEREGSLRIQDLTFAGESVREVEVVRRRKDGTLFPLSLSTSPLYNAQGEVFGAMALMLDLSERRAAERALAESETRWRRFVETMQEGVWMTDRRDALVFVNDQLAALLGYSREEVMGVSALEFVAPEFRALAAEKLEELKRGEKRRLELVLRRKNGTPLYAIVSACPQQDAAWAFEGLMGTVTDITELKAAAEEPRRRTQAAGGGAASERCGQERYKDGWQL